MGKAPTGFDFSAENPDFRDALKKRLFNPERELDEEELELIAAAGATEAALAGELLRDRKKTKENS